MCTYSNLNHEKQTFLRVVNFFFWRLEVCGNEVVKVWSGAKDEKDCGAVDQDLPSFCS